MKTQQVLSHLQAVYPSLSFGLVPTSDIAANFYPADIKDKKLPESMITFSYGGMCMFDPYSSECSRFIEDPSYYGLSEKDAKMMVAHNQLQIHF